MTRSDLKQMAKNALSGHWLICVSGVLVSAVITGGVAFFGFFYLPLILFLLVTAAVGGVMLFGVTKLFQQRMRGETVKISTVFSGFFQLSTAFIATFCTFVLQTAWSAIGFIPGILCCAASTRYEPALLLAILGVLMCFAGAYVGVFKALQYSQTLYLLLDHPELEAFEAIKQSKAIMAGRKVELLRLHLTFIPWYLTALITAGISLFFVLPYVFLTLSGYHDRLAAAQDDQNPVLSPAERH